jgi:hypothetical protein
MISIFSFGANRPDFIELQMHSFRKHLREEFELTVFNNAQFDSTGGAKYHDLHSVGKSVGVNVIDVVKIPDLMRRCQDIEPSGPVFNHQGLYTSANVAHAYALCYAWENYISKEKGNIAILDSDVFLIEPLSLTEMLDPHQMLNVPDGKPHADGRTFRYMWPTFMLANMATLPDAGTLNWWCGRVEDVPVDVGGQTYHYFQSHPDLDVAHVNRKHFQEADYDEFYLTNGDKCATVLHYRSGSNWNHRGSDYHRQKTEWLKGRIG